MDTENMNLEISPTKNIADTERLTTALVGSAMLLYGLRHSSKSGFVLSILGGGLITRSITGFCPLYAAAGWSSIPTDRRSMINAESVVTINKPAAVLYQSWRNLLNAPIVEDIPERRIAWHSDAEGDISYQSEITFQPAPGNRGTEVRLSMRYRPPAGLVGAIIASLLGREPGQKIAEDLRRFKQLMEAGEIATTRGQPAARPIYQKEPGLLIKRALDAFNLVRQQRSAALGEVK